MLVQPKVKMYVELDIIVLEVEDEGTMIKIDFTDKILSLVEELKAIFYEGGRLNGKECYFG